MLKFTVTTYLFSGHNSCTTPYLGMLHVFPLIVGLVAVAAATESWPGGPWLACRGSGLAQYGIDAASMSTPGWQLPAAAAGECIINAPVPGTALEALLANGSFTQPDGSPLLDPYVDDWLKRIPDVADIGRAFYAFTFTAQLATINVSACSTPGMASTARILLSLPQSSYRVTLHVDGSATPTAPVGARSGETDAVGMYRRFHFDLGPLATFCAAPVHAVSLRTQPPDVLGVPTGGQGGDKTIARNVVAQWLAGWDFSPPVPDRATGLLDGVFLTVAPAGVLLYDGAVAVSDLVLAPDDPARAASLRSTFRVSLLALGSDPVSGSLACSVPSVAGASWTGDVTVPGTASWVEAGGAAPSPLLDVPLWWPHTAGTPVLHNASCTFTAGGVATVVAWRVGFRTMTSTVNSTLGGRQFEVNGQRLFLLGGNFVGTDVLHRSSFRTVQRFNDEVRFHVRAGFNVMRLWGGSGGHPQALWDAADEAGILLFFEFWMTGDDNSPAKGGAGANASAPDDHAGYIEAARDSLRAARGHASLLLVCEVRRE